MEDEEGSWRRDREYLGRGGVVNLRKERDLRGGGIGDREEGARVGEKGRSGGVNLRKETELGELEKGKRGEKKQSGGTGEKEEGAGRDKREEVEGLT